MALLSFVSQPKKKKRKSRSNKNEVQLMEYYPIERLLVLKESEGKEERVGRQEKYLFLRIET